MKKTIKWILFGILGVAATVGIFFGAQALLDPYDCRILEDVSIGGLDVGGMTRREARAALKSAAEESLLSMELRVELPEETIQLSPADTELKLSVYKAVKAAYSHGRSGTEEEKAAAAETGCQVGLADYLRCNEDYIRQQLDAYAGSYDTTLSQYRCELAGTMPELSVERYDASAPCQTLELTMGVPELHLNVDAILGEIMALYDRAITAAAEDAYTVKPEVLPDTVPEEPDLDTIYSNYCIEAVNDSLDMKLYVPVTGSYGYHFNLENAKTMVDAADYGETVSIPMEYVEPEILGDEVYFRDELGFCDTKHTADEKRNHNLMLVCEILDGLILQPGEEFSFNGVVGERSPERGFQPAPAYSGNRLIKDYGGGVCQTSTTLYNCVLLADLEVTMRLCHGITVGYVPLGLDATVNWNTKTDMAFKNSSNFPIMLKAEVSDGYVRMKIMGTDEKDYYIKMRCTSGEDDVAIYAASYKQKYSKETDELISEELEARSTYYKNLG